MTKRKELDDIDKALKLLEEEDFITVTFKCMYCGEEDEVPDFVVEEFAFDLKKGEVVETACPFCDGTMREARNVPSD
jgi:aspartate carbamoyltransferase regulatory subunit